MKHLPYIFLLALFAGSALARGILRIPFVGARQSGMGNTGIALPDDSNMLFYNPAGLADVRKVTWHLFDITGGFDSFDTARRGYNALFNGDLNNLFRFDTPEQFKLNIRPTFFAPYFGFAVYNNLSSFTDFQSFQANDVDVAVFNDTGITAGIGLPIGKTFSLGFTAKGILRSASDITTDVNTLLTQYGATLTSFSTAAGQIIQDNLKSGYGFGFDAGMLWKIPLEDKETQVQLAATVENLGSTSFRQYSSSQEAPSALPMTYNFGGALIYESKKSSRFSLEIDVRDALSPGVSLLKMIHVGAEYKKNWFSLRGGIMEGYPTFGVSIETPPHTKIHFSSYAQELGDTLWERGTRFYMFQIVIGFNPI